MHRFGLIIVAATLAGCSSSSGGGDGMTRAERAAALEAALEEENISKPSALPVRGTASYTGFMTLGLPIGGETSDYVGDLDLQVDFGAARNQIAGTASNFDGLSGDLAISGGNIDQSTDTDIDYTFDGAVDGSFGYDGDSYTVDGSLVGEFRGRNQDGVTGVIYGDINGPDGQDLFDGTLAGTRDD